MDNTPPENEPVLGGQVKQPPVVRLEDLGGLIREKRDNEGLTLEDAAQQCGVSAPTLSRLERQRRLQGTAHRAESTLHTPDMRTVAAVTRWLGVSLNRLGDFEQPPPSHRVEHHTGDATPDIVEAHLRADPNLAPETAAALARMFRSAYDQFANFRPAPATGARPERIQENESDGSDKTA